MSFINTYLKGKPASHKATNILVPGIASYMEEAGETNVNIAVGGDVVPEEELENATAEHAEVVSQENEEITEGVAEAEAEDVAGEEVEMQLRRFEVARDYIKQYGLDQKFQMLMNYDGLFNGVFRNRGIGAEAFQATGSRFSPEAEAAMEGIGDALKAVWEWIKKVCGKIATFFGRLWVAIRSRIGDINSQIGYLRKALKERTLDDDKAKDNSTEVVSLEEIEKAFSGDLKTKMDACTTAMKTLHGSVGEIISDANEVAMVRSAGTTNTGDAREKEVKALEDAEKALKDAVAKIGDSGKVKAKNIDPEKYLNKASEYVSTVEKHKAMVDIVTDTAKKLEKLAQNQATRSGADSDDATAKAARKDTRAVQKASKIEIKVQNTYMVAARKLIAAVRTYLGLTKTK